MRQRGPAAAFQAQVYLRDGYYCESTKNLPKPDKVPTASNHKSVKAMNYQSIDEMKRMSGKYIGDMEVTTQDIEIWYTKKRASSAADASRESSTQEEPRSSP